MFPAPIRLNNPGALRHSESHWQGMTNLQDNDSFVRFSTPNYGIRAMMKTLKTYHDKHKIHTLRGIIYRWAPPEENDTKKYLAEVSRRTGIPPNVTIDIHNIDTMIAIAKAITIHECGYPPDDVMPASWYSEAVFHEAAVEVLNGV